MRRVFASARDAVRAQLWPLPVLGVVLAVVAGVALPHLDTHIDDSVPSWLHGLLFGGDAGAARTVLDAVSSSLITVTSLTFSLTVVTLQLASSQFSPRLLRTFTSDMFVQATLALFLATFSYSLTVLRSVRSSAQDGSAAFVPRLSVTVSFVLALASVLGLVLFLAHLARQIRVETMLRDVHAHASATARTVTEPRATGGVRTVPTAPDHAAPILAAASGFLVRIDETDVRAAAQRAHAIVVIERYPGSSLVQGTPIGVAWGAVGNRLTGAEFDTLRGAIVAAVHVGYERTAAQDIGYGLRQLTDVANKALSPGINDPTTAVHALGHVAALLCELAGQDLGPELLSDDDDRVCAALLRPSLADLLDGAITQPRRYGSSDPQVLARLYRLLEELAWHVPHESALPAQLARLRATVSGADFDDTERDQLAECARRVDTVLARGASG